MEVPAAAVLTRGPTWPLPGNSAGTVFTDAGLEASVREVGLPLRPRRLSGRGTGCGGTGGARGGGAASGWVASDMRGTRGLMTVPLETVEGTANACLGGSGSVEAPPPSLVWARKRVKLGGCVWTPRSSSTSCSKCSNMLPTGVWGDAARASSRRRAGDCGPFQRAPHAADEDTGKRGSGDRGRSWPDARRGLLPDPGVVAGAP